MLALFVLLSIASLSVSICVRDERSPMNSCASIIIVHKSDIVDNSVTLIVELQSQMESECQIETTANAKMGEASLGIAPYSNSSWKVKIPSEIREGKHIVSLSYTYSGCDEVIFSHEIYIHVLDDPELVHETEDPHIFHCKTDTDLPTLWVEFLKDDEAIGYCGPFASPVQHKGHATVYYDGILSTCVLKIDTKSTSANGNYYCSLILPFPNEDGYLKTNSTPVEIKNTENKGPNLKLILGIGVPVFLVFIIVIVVVTVGISLCCRRNKNMVNLPPQNINDYQQMPEGEDDEHEHYQQMPEGEDDEHEHIEEVPNHQREGRAQDDLQNSVIVP